MGLGWCPLKRVVLLLALERKKWIETQKINVSLLSTWYRVFHLHYVINVIIGLFKFCCATCGIIFSFVEIYDGSEEKGCVMYWYSNIIFMVEIRVDFFFFSYDFFFFLNIVYHKFIYVLFCLSQGGDKIMIYPLITYICFLTFVRFIIQYIIFYFNKFFEPNT